MESKGTPGEIPKTEIPQILMQIGEWVRADSKNKGKLTSVDLLAMTVPEPIRIQFYVDEMVKSEAYKDIKRIASANGSLYLYSENTVLRKDAERFTYYEEVRGQIVSRVRDDSSKLVKLTTVTALGTLIPGAELDKIDNQLIRLLYSESHMTRNYAELLALAEANDPLATIAATVRNDSRIYPRPTKLEIFAVPIFNINPDALDKYASELVKLPEYKDIKLVKASTGAIYLYSDLYLNADLVKATVEWEEIGKHQNP
jgi:hypothetical protein